jgi:HSP20 family protein
MSLIRWQPFHELDNLRNQMNHLFEELVRGEREIPFLPKGELVWSPAVELKETETEVILKAQIPGIEAKDLNVEVSQESVSITGEHREEKKSEEKGFFRSEFRYGKFERLVPLPTPVKNDQIRSEFKNGLLTLTMPKLEKSARKVVKVDLTEEARQMATEARQYQEHLQDTMTSRLAEEKDTHEATEVQEVARELTTEQRQQEEQLQQNMLERSEENLASTSS